MLQRLVAASDRQRFEHIIVSLTSGGPLAAGLRSVGIEVHELGLARRNMAIPLLRGWLSLRSLLGRYRPALVQTWLYHADLLGIVAAARRTVVWNVRSSYHDGLRSLTVRSCARLSPLPAAVVVNSTAGRDLHARIGYRPRRWEVIPNGFDVAVFAPDPRARDSVRSSIGIGGTTPLIGLVARVDRLKDHLTFVRAAELMVREMPDTRFLLVGDGTDDDPSLGRWLESSRVSSQIVRMGRRSDIARITAALDVATSSSLAEGFSNTVGEAMACAVPCVVTNVGDSAEIVGDSGAVVPPGDPVALMRAWHRLLTLAPSDRARLGETARERIRSRYSIGSIVQRYEALYEDLGSSAR